MAQNLTTGCTHFRVSGLALAFLLSVGCTTSDDTAEPPRDPCAEKEGPIDSLGAREVLECSPYWGEETQVVRTRSAGYYDFNARDSGRFEGWSFLLLHPDASLESLSVYGSPVSADPPEPVQDKEAWSSCVGAGPTSPLSSQELVPAALSLTQRWPTLDVVFSERPGCGEVTEENYVLISHPDTPEGWSFYSSVTFNRGGDIIEFCGGCVDDMISVVVCVEDCGPI